MKQRYRNRNIPKVRYKQLRLIKVEVVNLNPP
jgi:hypothetical protein